LVSCSSDGNCAAGGRYKDSSGNYQAFVVDEVAGVWGTASEVAGSLNTGGSAQVFSVSCPSDGNCSAGGRYRDSSGSYQAFVVDEVAGVWGTASEVAGSLNTGGLARVEPVSCTSDGNCAAGGYYKDGSGNIQAFVFDEVYTVTFNVNGGSVTMSAESYTTGVAKVLTANAFTFTGYTFTGWNTAANGSGTAYTDGQIITISADVSLCAQWIAKPLPKEILKAHPSNAPFGGQVHLRIHLFGKMGTVSGRVEVSFAGKTICSAALVDGVAVCSL
jgi:uncharacterized repeat protein (TIGR02543 family)